MAMLTRTSWVKIILIALLCLVLCGGLIGCSVGCSAAARHAGGLAGMMYEGVSFSERGDFSVAAQDVRSLEISWLAGGVDVVVVDDDALDEPVVTGVEQYNGSARDSQRMTWQLRNGVLQIGYGSVRMGIFGCSTNDSKHLALTLPRSVAQSLESVNLSAASGTYSFGPISCNCLNIDLASGRVEGEQVAAQSLDLDMASGNIDLEGSFSQSVNLKLASGNVDLVCPNACPARMSFDVASGQVTLTIPEDSGFTASIDKLSGAFNCDIPGSWNLPNYNLLVCGDGARNMDVSMASGNVTVRGA